MKATKDQLNAVYDEFRTAKLNQEYYAERMQAVRKRLRAMDIFLALFATGSGVLGFALWNVQFLGFQVGQITLGFLSGVALMVAIAKPYLKLDDELERLSSIQGSYDSISHIMEDLVKRIGSQHDIDDASDEVYRALRQIRGHLGPKEDKPPQQKLAEEVQGRINRRYPIDEFWYPNE